MKTISYSPSKDELIVKLCPTKGKPARDFGPVKLWWDDEGNICALSIRPYTRELDEFKRNLKHIRLGGLWKGMTISEKELSETRKSLLRQLEEKW